MPFLMELVYKWWRFVGIYLEKTTEDEDGKTIFWISVPEGSYLMDEARREMAGKALANRFCDLNKMIGYRNYIVRARTRQNEYWTKEDSQYARFLSVIEWDLLKHNSDIMNGGDDYAE